MKNLNKQGDTNVRAESIVENADIKGTMEAEWDDFQLMGDDEKDERRYVAPPEADEILMELKRAKSKKVGHSILTILSHTA